MPMFQKDEDPRDSDDIARDISDMFEVEMEYDRKEQGGTEDDPNVVVHWNREGNHLQIELRNGSKFLITVERTS